MDAEQLSRASDRRRGRESIELALRADLLERSDHGVGDDDPEEQRVTLRVEHQREHAERDQDHVRDRQRVCADDARVGAARLRRTGVAPADEPARGLRAAQSGGCCPISSAIRAPAAASSRPTCGSRAGGPPRRFCVRSRSRKCGRPEELNPGCLTNAAAPKLECRRRQVMRR